MSVATLAGPAIGKQKWYLGKLAGVDVKGLALAKAEASLMIELALKGSAELVKAELVKKGAKPAASGPGEFSAAAGVKSPAAIWKEAHAAGLAAASNCKPVPMVVQQHENVMDDSSPVVQQWYVPSGVCGFAWIQIRPARGKFVSWAKKQGLGQADSYAGGFKIWISEFGQSMELKEAYASAAAKSLRENGVNAYADSRMD